jgi:hypothetical protein
MSTTLLQPIDYCLSIVLHPFNNQLNDSFSFCIINQASDAKFDNFRMNTRYGRYGAAYSMFALLCFK